MKTKKELLQEKINKLIRRRKMAMEIKDWMLAADLEIRIIKSQNKLRKLR